MGLVQAMMASHPRSLAFLKILSGIPGDTRDYKAIVAKSEIYAIGVDFIDHPIDLHSGPVGGLRCFHRDDTQPARHPRGVELIGGVELNRLGQAAPRIVSLVPEAKTAIYPREVVTEELVRQVQAHCIRPLRERA